MTRPSAPAPLVAYRVKDLAARLQVEPGRVLVWIRSGKLKAIDVSEGSGVRHRWRITPEALAAFEASRTAGPTIKVGRRRAKSGAWQFQYF